MKNKPPIFLGLALSAAFAPAWARVEFEAPVRPPVLDTAPGESYAIDLNHDGVGDLIWVNKQANTVSVMLGNGDWSFQPRVDYATGSEPMSLQINYIDGDRVWDLVVANHGSDSVSVLLGNGDGTFKAKIDTPTGHLPVSVGSTDPAWTAFGVDLSQDGKTDLVVSNEGDNTFSTLLGKGDGSFQPKIDTPTGGKPGAILLGMTTTGFYAPGVYLLRPDDDLLSVFVNNGPGTYGGRQDYATGRHPVSLSAATGVDRTYYPTDMFVANEGDNSVSLLLSDKGDGTFQSKIDLPVGAKPTFIPAPEYLSYLRDPSCALSYPCVMRSGLSLGGYGNSHLIVANSGGNSVTVLRSTSAEKSYQFERADYPVGANPASIAVHDFNGDTWADLAVFNAGDNSLSFYAGSAGGTGVLTQPKTQEYPAGQGPAALAWGDINGDGTPDLAVADTQDNTVSILLGNGDGSYRERAAFAVGKSPTGVALGDLNGDGKPDLATANGGGNSVSVLLGDGLGGFSAKTDFAVGAAPSAVALGDLNGDNRADLVTADAGNNRVSVLLGDGNGAFQVAQRVVVGKGPSALALGDANGDGKTDLAVANGGSGTVWLLLGQGDGGFGSHRRFTMGAAPSAVALADVSGDGKADLMVANAKDNTVSVLLGRGKAKFRAKTDFATANDPRALAVGDVNGDRRPDLLVAAGAGDSVSVLAGLGDGGFQPRVDFQVGGNPLALALLDGNGDHKPDLVTANRAGNNVSVLLNKTSSKARFEPAALVFDSVVAGQMGQPKTLVLSNPGDAELGISDIAIVPAGDFIQTNDCPSLLPAGESCTFQVTFTPQRKGARTASLSFLGSDSPTPYTVALNGLGASNSADLYLTLAFSPETPVLGGLARQTYHVVNQGASDASAVVLTDYLPTGASLFHASLPCTQTGQQLRCNLGDLATGGTASLDVWMVPAKTGTLVSSAIVAAAQPDADATDNKVQLLATVAAADTSNSANVSVVLAGPATAKLGETVTYQATLSNKGPQSAKGVLLSLPLPAGATYHADASDWQCAAQNGKVACQLYYDLAKDVPQTLAIALSYDSAKTYSLKASARAFQADSQLANNTATVQTVAGE